MKLKIEVFLNKARSLEVQDKDLNPNLNKQLYKSLDKELALSLSRRILFFLSKIRMKKEITEYYEIIYAFLTIK